MWDPGPFSSDLLLAGDGGEFLCWPLVVAFASTTCFLVLHRLGVALWVVLTPIVPVDRAVWWRPAAPLCLVDHAPGGPLSDSVDAAPGGLQRPPRRRVLRWLWRRLCSSAVAFEAAWVGSRRRRWSKRSASRRAMVLAVGFVNRHGVRVPASVLTSSFDFENQRMAGGGGSDFLDGLQQFCLNFRQETDNIDSATSRQLKAVEDLVGRARRQPGFDFLDGLQKFIDKERANAGDSAAGAPTWSSGWDDRWDDPSWRDWSAWEEEDGPGLSYQRPADWPTLAPAKPPARQQAQRRVVAKPSSWQSVAWRPRLADWKSDKASSVNFVQGQLELSLALDKAPDVPLLVLAQGVDDFSECVGIAEGEPKAMITILLTADHHWPEEDAAHKPVTSRIPGSFQRSLQVRTCFCKSFASGSPALVTKQQVATASIAAYKASAGARRREGWVLRLVCPWKFHGSAQDWKKVVSNPGRAARDWATCAINSHKDLGDTFKFELLDGDKSSAQLRGLMRVAKEEAAASLLKASGQADDLGRRWFVEPVHGELQAVHQGVLWHDWQPEESWLDYLKRAVRLSNQGVVLGRVQLGSRVPKDDKRLADKVSTWRACRCPRHWSGEMVCDLFASLGFRQADVFQKCNRGPEVDWVIRAIAPNANDLFQPSVKDGDGALTEIAIVREARRRQHRGSAVDLKREQNVTYRHVPKDKPSQLRDKRVVLTQPAVDPDGDATMQSPPGTEEQEAKRSRKAPESSAGKAAKASPWFPEGAQRVKNDGRGDCLFHALADGLKEHAPEQQASARSVRAFLHAWMSKHKDEYAALWDGVKAGAANKDAAPDWKGGFEDYLNDIRIAGTYGCYLELAAAAHACKRDILVLDANGQVTVFSHGGKEKELCLFYDPKVPHYEYLTGPVQDELRFWGSPHRASRGCGGGSLKLADFASSASSLRLSAFASAPASRKRTRESDSQPPPPKRKPGSAASDRLSLRDFASAAPSAEPRGHAGASPSWTPNAAELRHLRAPGAATASSGLAASASEVRCNPDQDLAGCLQETDPASAGKPEPSRRWPKSKYEVEGGFRFECELCPFVSEHDSRHRATIAAARHYRRAHPDRPRRKFTPRAARPPLVKAGDFPGKLSWSCPLCAKGWLLKDVDGCPNTLLVKWRAEHRLELHPRVTAASWRKALSRQRQTPQFRTARRVDMLNKSIAVPNRVSDMKKAGFDLFTWPRLVPHTASKTKGAKRLQMLRAWKCAKCQATFREKRGANEHRCGGPRCIPVATAKQRLAKLKAARRWADAHPDLHGLAAEDLHATFDAALQILEAEPGLRK